MRVMLVCMQGITTSVLSAKLTKYSQEQGRQDTFTACKLNLYPEMLSQMDAVLLSPQAIRAAGLLRTDAAAQNIPVIDLEEEDFAFARLDRIYTALLAAVEAAHAAQKPEEPAFRLTLLALAKIVGRAYLSCVPVLLLGLLALALSHLPGLEGLEHLWQVTGGIISVFVLFALGVQYGRASRGGALTCGLLTVVAPMLLILNVGDSTEPLPFRASVGTLPLEMLGLSACIPLTMMGVLAVGIIHGVRHVQSRRGWMRRVIGMPMMDPLFYGSALFSAFLLLRLGIAALL